MHSIPSSKSTKGAGDKTEAPFVEDEDYRPHTAISPPTNPPPGPFLKKGHKWEDNYYEQWYREDYEDVTKMAKRITVKLRDLLLSSVRNGPAHEIGMGENGEGDV
jgi:hypothetical protein